MEAPGVAASGSTGADCIDVLYKRYRRSLCRWAARILQSHADAEDAVQDAFLKLAQEIDERSLDLRGFEDRRITRRGRRSWDGPIAAWLFRLVTRIAFNKIQREPRRAGREDAYSRIVVARPFDPARLREREHTIEQVWTVLEQLPERIRLLLYLWAAGESYREIGAAIGMGPVYVGKALTRARRAFRAKYRVLYKVDSTGRTVR